MYYMQTRQIKQQASESHHQQIHHQSQQPFIVTKNGFYQGTNFVSNRYDLQKISVSQRHDKVRSITKTKYISNLLQSQTSNDDIQLIAKGVNFHISQPKPLTIRKHERPSSSTKLPRQIVTQQASPPSSTFVKKTSQYHFAEKKDNDNNFTYYVGPGNNGELVVRVMETRNWWKPTSAINSIFNLKWQQSIHGFKFDRLNTQSGVCQIVNHFPIHKVISDKVNLILNLKLYCEYKKQMIWEITPLTFIVNLQEEDAELQMSKFASFFLKNLPKSRRPENAKKIANDWKNRVKTLLLNPVQEKFNKTQSVYTKPQMHPSFISGDDYLWLLKPSDFNRGRGIQLFDSLETLERQLFEFKNGMCEYNLGEEETSSETKNLSKIKSQEFVIQKYIQRPLLINRRKFDIRIWVLISHGLEVFIFKEGYLRTSTEEFTLQNIDNAFIHLTNNAVQKRSTNYGLHESGNQLSFWDFEKFLTQERNQGSWFQDKIWPGIKEKVVTTLQSVRKYFSEKEYKYCFEIFGYDFILDDQLNSWLIEVNTNPCIEESSPLLKMLLPRMLNDAMRLTIDMVYPRPKKGKQTMFPVMGYDDNENMWELQMCMRKGKPQQQLTTQ